MTVHAINRMKIVKKRKLKVRRFQSDRNPKVKVYKYLAFDSQAGGNQEVLITELEGNWEVL